MKPAKLAGWASRWLTGELQALASVGNWEGAITTFVQMSDVTKEEPVPGSASSASSLSSSSSSPSSVAYAAATNARLEQQQKQSRVYHYTTIISACGKAGQWEAALQAFTHMHRSRVEPNIRTYTSVLHACTAGGRLDSALRAWAMMTADGVVANCFATTALVSAFAKAGRWDEALRTVVDSESAPFPHQEPNVFTYTAAMDACRRDGTKAATAVAILDRMKERGVRGNTVSYATALHACATNRSWECALQVLERMRDDRVRAIPFARTCALEALSDAPQSVAAAGIEPYVGMGGARRQFQAAQRRQQQSEQYSSGTISASPSFSPSLTKRGGEAEGQGEGGEAAAAAAAAGGSEGGEQQPPERERGASRAPDMQPLSEDMMDLIQDPPPPNE